MGAPAVTVVVATRNRSQLLSRLIDALADQTGAPPFELVAVDDASDDTTQDVLAELADRSPFEVRALRLPRNAGPAAARNAGWRIARAPVVAFTDDDCMPQPGWLAALVDGLSSADIVQGATRPNPTQPPIGWFAWAPENSSENGWYETCNIAYRRSFLDATDGFDEAFGPGRTGGAGYVAPTWGEDTDLALRAIAAGATTAFAGDAVVWHDLKPGRLRDRLADLPRREGFVATVRRHPQLRARLEAPGFAQHAHAELLVAGVATAWALTRPSDWRRWAVAGAAGAAWARRRGQHYPRRTWPKVLPQWLVVDAAETAVYARASLRHRTLVL